MSEVLDSAVNMHLRSAITVIRECGSFASTLWAQSDNASVFACATSPEGGRVDSVERSCMLAWMAEMIDATVFGHTDEAWSRSYGPEEMATACPGDLAKLAETDPEVVTALVVQAGTVEDGKMMCGIAMPSVLDDGSREWTLTVPVTTHNGTGILSGAYDLLQRIDHDGNKRTTLEHLGKVFGTMGWTLVKH